MGNVNVSASNNHANTRFNIQLVNNGDLFCRFSDAAVLYKRFLANRVNLDLSAILSATASTFDVQESDILRVIKFMPYYSGSQHKIVECAAVHFVIMCYKKGASKAQVCDFCKVPMSEAHMYIEPRGIPNRTYKLTLSDITASGPWYKGKKKIGR